MYNEAKVGAKNLSPLPDRRTGVSQDGMNAMCFIECRKEVLQMVANLRTLPIDERIRLVEDI